MRVRLAERNLDKLFRAALEHGHNWERVARKCRASSRTLRDWRQGKLTLPSEAFDTLTRIARLQKSSLFPKYQPDFWHIKEAGRLGAYARQERYGDLGTVAGRRKGGLNSLITHNKFPTGFVTLKQISFPKESEQLAELLGIFFGDGHLSEYQALVTTNSITDRQHAMFSKRLLGELFNISATVTLKRDENTLNVVACSKTLVNFLKDKGMPVGNKIHNGLSVPQWVQARMEYRIAFLRGLFDTDGSLYVDTHHIREKKYQNLGWTITSYADTLLNDVLTMLENFGFSPTNRSSQKSVFMRKRSDIDRYFRLIGTHNKKHARRYQIFVKAGQRG